MAIKLIQTTPAAQTDVTQLISSVKLSGSLQSCCRTLSAEVLVSPDSGRIPYVYFALGATLRLWEDDKLLFYGTIVSKEKSTDATTMTVTCFDRGFYLKNNYATYNFKGQTPEDITRRLCRDFGIGVGALPSTGVKLSRKFRGAALYAILDTVWTMAGDQKDKRYWQRFDGPDLTVTEKQATAEGSPEIRTGINLISADYSESIEQMVNRVSIYDENDKLIRSVSDDAAVKTYGLLRRILSRTKDDNKEKEAKRLLEDQGVERRTTVHCLGNASLQTGGTVRLHEPYTGQFGLFWIDADEHRWSADGTYKNKLTLNFRNMTREGSAGQEDK